MTATTEPGSERVPTLSRAVTDPGCVACEFVDAAVRRRIFFTLVEGLGEYWFVRAMQAGGFCQRHARDVVAAGGGPGLTTGLLDVLDGWARRFDDPARPDARIGHACYLCETEAWAEGFAIGLLAGRDQAYALAQLGRLEPLCLRHLERVVAHVPWHRVPAVARGLDARLQAAAAITAERLADAIAVVAGRDPNAASHAPAHRPTDGPGEPGPAWPEDRPEGWAAGSLTMRGLRLELAAGRCPACTGAAAAIRAYLRWLGRPDANEERGRERDSLCADHLHDARRWARLAAVRGLAAAEESWWRAAQVLLEPAPQPTETLGARTRAAPAAIRAAWSAEAGTRRPGAAIRAAIDHLARPGRTITAVRSQALRQRRRPCVACQAMATASGRTIDLLGALLAGPAGVRFYEETSGLCLRHVAAAVRRLEGQRPERDVVRAHARARAREVRWELEEWVRKSSWSVRYEPRGPEGAAWRRAMVFLLGEDILATDLLATEPEGPRPAA